MNARIYWSTIIFTTVACLMLAGCQAKPLAEITIDSPTAINEPATTLLIATEEHAKTPLSTLTTNLELTPTSVVCDQPAGSISTEGMTSAIMGENLTYKIYLPPCYDPAYPEGYPVLYLLHGQIMNESFFLDMGMHQQADALITQRLASPFLIVMPVEKYYLQDLSESVYPRVIAEELVPLIDQKYPTCTERECRAIGGISRGAAWAVHITFSYRNLFAYVGAHSPAVFSADIVRIPFLLRDYPDAGIPTIYIDSGNQDAYLQSAKDLEAVLMQYGVPHEWHENIGIHNFEYWLAHAAEYMQWYASHWPPGK